MIIRKATKQDYNNVWNIFSEVIKTGDTYVFNPKTKKEELKNIGLQIIVIEDCETKPYPDFEVINDTIITKTRKLNQ